MTEKIENGITVNTTEYVDAGIKLTYTPLVSEDDMITSAVHTEVSTPTLVSEIKNYKITSRTADTYVRMRNGETLIIGGLINEEEQKNIQKIPFLSNIPILGELFKNRSTTKNKTEVMMILTPHITEAGASPAIYDTQSLENEFKDFDDNRFLKDIKKSERSQAENKLNFRRYRMQSKVILITTVLLIILPAILFFANDFGEFLFKKRLLYSIFQSVTTRTAGFNTADLPLMTEAGKAVMILLMLIGGSPSSTAGGMKTTTFAVLILNAFATFRSREDAGAFGRRFDVQVIKNAATIAMLYLMLFFGGGIIISAYEGLPVLTCFYEAASAIGTVGLTLGVTPDLHIISRLILIVLMYLGRVGGLTLIYAVFSGKNNNNARMPMEKITVG